MVRTFFRTLSICSTSLFQTFSDCDDYAVSFGLSHCTGSSLGGLVKNTGKTWGIPMVMKPGKIL